jgi:hypothetical protein
MTETTEQATTVIEITCPECERVWPTIAEQGIVTELIDRCYMCFSKEVAEQRLSREESANYTVQNCSGCGGLPPKVEKCIACGGKGWETTAVNGAADTPQIATSSYKH